MQLVSKSDKEIRMLLCAVDILSKYTSSFSLKDKKKLLQLLKHFRKFWIDLDTNQTKYALIQAASFTINH